jgi:hypothetical protein
MVKKRWSELSVPARAGVVGVAVVQVGLLVAARIDINRRPAALIRGPKRVWRLVCWINIVGPLLYFFRGRR